MSRTTKDASNHDDHSPSLPPPAAAASATAASAPRGCHRQTTEGARSKSSAAELERTDCEPIQETSSLQPPPIDELLMLKEDVDEEIDEKAKQQLLKETMETYREDFLNEHCERKLLWEEVSSLRQQVHLLLSELTTARKLVASQADELSLLKKQRNDLISILHGHKKEDVVDSDGEKRRRDKSASLPSSNDGSLQSAWKCLICTFENPGERQTCCEVCGSLRSKDNETTKMTKSSTTSTGKLESDQVMKIKRRKCGKSGEHHVPSTLIYSILYAVESEKSNLQNNMSQKYTGARPNIVQSPYFKQIEPNIHPTPIR